MANTVIAIKKSATPAAAPSSLANGELAINYADGKLYYKNATGVIVSISATQSNSFGTVNANNTLVVADTPGGILTLVPGNNITIVGDAINDKITFGLKDDIVIPPLGSFLASAAGGDEGGEIHLANAVTNSVINSYVVIDIYQNKLRFFETGSPNRGAFINLAAAATSVGTDLLSAAGTTDSTARSWAGAAYDQANTARGGANTVGGYANSAYGSANLAWSQANSAFAQANLVFGTANTGAIAYGAANIAWAQANSAYTKANSINVFTALTDVPSSYANSAGYLVTVNPGGTGLQFSQDISLDELIHSARVAPTVIANDSVTVYVTASGTTPNREVAYKIKNEFGEEVIISSILT